MKKLFLALTAIVFSGSFAFGQSTSWDTDGSYKIQTASNGYIDIGPSNSTFCHIKTNRNQFYFNKQIVVNAHGGNATIYSYDEDLVFGLWDGGNKTEAMRLQEGTGNVGIGTTSPTATLTLKTAGSEGTGLDLWGDNGTGWDNQIRFHNATNLQHVIGSNLTNNRLFIFPGIGGGGSKVVELAGKLKIGNEEIPSDAHLSVDGKIYCEEVKVQLSENWADYVFADNYKLQSLEEVESYIKENKHLPNVPSAEEVEEKGLNVSEMLKKQMEKIEELTLYVIEQNKKLEEQAQKLDEQQEKLEAQKKEFEELKEEQESEE